MSFNNINSLFESLLSPYINDIDYDTEIKKIINFYDIQSAKYPEDEIINKYKNDITKIKYILAKNSNNKKSKMTIYYYLLNIQDDIENYLATKQKTKNSTPESVKKNNTEVKKTGRLENEESDNEMTEEETDEIEKTEDDDNYSNYDNEDMQEEINEEEKEKSSNDNDEINNAINQFMDIVSNYSTKDYNKEKDNNKEVDKEKIISTPLKSTKPKKIENDEQSNNNQTSNDGKINITNVKKEYVNQVEQNNDTKIQTLFYWYKGEENYLTISCTERLIKVVFIVDDTNIFKKSNIKIINDYLATQKINIELTDNLTYNSIIDDEYDKYILCIKVLKILVDNQEDFKKYIEEINKKDDNLKKDIQDLIDNIKLKYSFIPNIENHIKRIFDDIVKHEYIDKNTLDYEIIYKPLYEILKNSNDKEVKNINNYNI